MTKEIIKNKNFRNLLSAPFILGMIVPIFLADVCLEIYHHICFPLYGITLVKRSHYIRITDRTRLPYLFWYEKINCAYCGYANGWFHYASVIAGKTESYWCAVAHLEDRGYVATPHELSFARYGDEGSLHRRYADHEDLYGQDG